VIAAGGPALLFTRPAESSFPLVTNLFGTARRAEAAFGEKPFHLIERLVLLSQELMPPTLSGLWGAREVIWEALRIGTRRIGRGPLLHSVSRDVDLNRLPVLTSWPDDGGPFITLPLVSTEHPDGDGRNLGMYRLQVHDRRTTGMHWQIGKGGGFHYAVAEAREQPLPVTVYLGGPPAVMLAAIAPLPENVPELLLASLLLGQKLRLCPGPEGGDLLADCEFAFGGKVPPRVRRPEGPFGDHYGYYSLAHEYPVFEIEWMANREDAIYPATVVGKPRQEDVFIGDLLQELLAPLFPLVMPGVIDLWSYGETGYHSLAAAVVKERYKREAMASAFRILGESQLSLTKFLLVTDREVDLKDFKATLVHVLERTLPETDLFVFGNLSMDTLDYSGPRLNEGSKGVWLGLGEAVRQLPREFRSEVLPGGVSEVRVFCPGCLVIGGPSVGDEPMAGERLAAAAAFRDWPLLVLTDEPVRAAASSINFLWTTFTRFEPAADLYAAASRVVRNQIAYSPPILIDARRKPDFPAELFSSEETSSRVTRRWREYFPQGGIEMGDSDRSHLDG
jgi:UbiD family decarboxylase